MIYEREYRIYEEKRTHVGLVCTEALDVGGKGSRQQM